MKKISILALLFIMLAMTVTYAAEDSDNSSKNPMEWEISMMPKPTAEEIEEARWSVVLENDVGIYAYDMSSINYVNQSDNIISAEVKTLFTNPNILKNLRKQYSNSLKAGEKILYCKIIMQFDLDNNEYAVTSMDVYTDKDRIIESKRNSAKYVRVPKESVAEVMFEICKNFSLNNKEK